MEDGEIRAQLEAMASQFCRALGRFAKKNQVDVTVRFEIEYGKNTEAQDETAEERMAAAQVAGRLLSELGIGVLEEDGDGQGRTSA